MKSRDGFDFATKLCFLKNQRGLDGRLRQISHINLCLSWVMNISIMSILGDLASLTERAVQEPRTSW